jgi:hypothetical protein
MLQIEYELRIESEELFPWWQTRYTWSAVCGRIRYLLHARLALFLPNDGL